VAPDIFHAHTLADFRADYTGYIQAFTDALLAEIAATPNP
jgi:hypothetical protein